MCTKENKEFLNCTYMGQKGCSLMFMSYRFSNETNLFHLIGGVDFAKSPLLKQYICELMYCW